MQIKEKAVWANEGGQCEEGCGVKGRKDRIGKRNKIWENKKGQWEQIKEESVGERRMHSVLFVLQYSEF